MNLSFKIKVIALIGLAAAAEARAKRPPEVDGAYIERVGDPATPVIPPQRSTQVVRSVRIIWGSTANARTPVVPASIAMTAIGDRA